MRMKQLPQRLQLASTPTDTGAGPSDAQEPAGGGHPAASEEQEGPGAAGPARPPAGGSHQGTAPAGGAQAEPDRMEPEQQREAEKPRSPAEPRAPPEQPEQEQQREAAAEPAAAPEQQERQEQGPAPESAPPDSAPPARRKKRKDQGRFLPALLLAASHPSLDFFSKRGPPGVPALCVNAQPGS